MANNRYQGEGSTLKRKDSPRITQVTFQGKRLSKDTSRRRFQLNIFAPRACFFQGEE